MANIRYLLIACLAIALASPRSCLGKLVIFGDSISDQGTDGIVSATSLVENRFSTGPVNVGVYPPSPYYFGRFSNGFIWVDVAAALLGQQVNNYACGGSNGFDGEVTVAPPFAYVTSKTKVPARSLVQQADAYAALNADATATATDTVVIFTGADEYYQTVALNTGAPSAEDLLSAINETISIAYTAGARNFVVANLPPLAKFPFAASSDSSSLSSIQSTVNDQLTTLASSLNSTNSGSSVIVYDVAALFTEVLASPNSAAYGPTPFTNTTGYCRGTSDLDVTQAAGFALDNCPNGDAYIFWDVVHPSKHMHQVIGQDFAAKTGYKTSASLKQATATA